MLLMVSISVQRIKSFKIFAYECLKKYIEKIQKNIERSFSYMPVSVWWFDKWSKYLIILFYYSILYYSILLLLVSAGHLTN
jgi:hypothetical protein